LDIGILLLMRILIIEDDEYIIEFLERSLSKDKHIVDTARSGDVGYDKALSRNHDIVILDVLLPRKDGLSICRDLRGTGYTKPIIMLSSQDSYSSRIRGLDAGADDYMVKPFSYQELKARLRALGRRPAKVMPTVLKAHGIELNPVNREVTKNGKVLPLRPKEYLLLEYFMKNIGEAVAREELLQKVWGIGTGNTSNRLDVYIKHLRTQIDDSEAKGSLIKTVRGMGYRLIEESK
jgi:two-component system copper resistance phosphate regulon response regulator CusR